MMQQRLIIAFALTGLTAWTHAALAGQVNLLTNGDFEDLTDWGAVGDPPENAPLGWRDFSGRLNGAGQQAGTNAIGGSGVSAYLPADAGVATAERKEISQTVAQSGPIFQYEFDFASEDPGDASARSLSVSTRDGDDDGLTVTLRINGDGDLQRFGGGWDTLLPSVMVFDDDVAQSPLVHHFSMTVDTTDVPSYDIAITDSNGVVHSAQGVTDFRGTPALGAGGTGIEFNTFLSSGDVVIDNVSLVTVPEPAGVLTLLIGASIVLSSRRR